MPVTMTHDEPTNARSRGKVCAQIYRPPPARSVRGENGPLQQQQPRQQLSQPPLQNHIFQPLLNNQYHQPPYSNRQRTDSESSYASHGSHYKGGNSMRGKRPDQVLYVPKGRRYVESNSNRGTPTPLQDLDHTQRPPSPALSISSVASEFRGSNRYRQDSRQGSQLSIYDGDLDRIKSKPPSRGDFSRESMPSNARQRGGRRFNTDTLKLIERCLNHDSDSRSSGNQTWESNSNSSPSKNNQGSMGRNQKSPTPARDFHSIHSKENVNLPPETSSRNRKGRRNRRNRSREASVEKFSDNRGSLQNGDAGSSYQGERGFGSCERVFYNSNYGDERYDRGYDNYDRYSSISNSCASSRNSSRERTPQHTPNHSWRGGSSPSSPSKSYTTRNSPGKPPSGRLGSLPNVSLEICDSPRKVLNMNSEDHRYHTLPVKHTKSPPHADPRDNTINNSCLSDMNSQPHSLEDGPSQSYVEEMDPRSSSHSQEQNSLDNSLGAPSLVNSVPCSNSPNPVEVAQTTRLGGDTVESSSQHHINCDDSYNGQNLDSNHSTILQDSSGSDSMTNQPEGENVDEIPTTSTTEYADVIPSSSEKVYFDLGGPEDVAEGTTLENGSTESREQAENVETNGVPEVREEKINVKKFSFNWADETEDSWDALYDDSGECLDPEIKRQLSDSIGKVKLVKPANDYYDYQPKDAPVTMNEEEYAHVIEVYDFPPAFKTQDLMMVFSPYQNNGFDIKWVDDTHALGIFSSALIAKEALSIDHPFLKARTLSLATETSRAKAVRITEALLPYKPRPATSASLARRLVSGALGLKVDVPREVREAERQKLKDAKARKRLAAKQKVDAWEGTLT